jgi:hypothetical protein
MQGASQKIRAAVTAWEGVTARFDGEDRIMYHLGGREFGHTHGDESLHIPFPKEVQNDVIRSKKARPHGGLAEEGWVALELEEGADVDDAVALMRRSYDIEGS